MENSIVTTDKTGVAAPQSNSSLRMDSEPLIAVYWDFENIHISLDRSFNESGEHGYVRSYGQQPKFVKIQPLMDFIKTFGVVTINRAYADWTYFRVYSTDFLRHWIDLIQLFPRGHNAKNGADIRMSVDIIEDIQTQPRIEKVIIVSGDSDYIGVIQKLRQKGKYVIGIGAKGSVNPYLVSCCNEFKYYDNIVESPDMHRPKSSILEAKKLLQNACNRLIARNCEPFVLMAQIKPTMQMLDPGFDVATYGFKTVSEFLNACSDVVSVVRGMPGQEKIYLLKENGDSSAQVNGVPSEDAQTTAKADASLTQTPQTQAQSAPPAAEAKDSPAAEVAASPVRAGTSPAAVAEALAKSDPEAELSSQKQVPTPPPASPPTPTPAPTLPSSAAPAQVETAVPAPVVAASVPAAAPVPPHIPPVPAPIPSVPETAEYMKGYYLQLLRRNDYKIPYFLDALTRAAYESYEDTPYKDWEEFFDRTRDMLPQELRDKIGMQEYSKFKNLLFRVRLFHFSEDKKILFIPEVENLEVLFEKLYEALLPRLICESGHKWNPALFSLAIFGDDRHTKPLDNLYRALTGRPSVA